MDMLKEKSLKKFKKLNAGDVMGVIRTLYPNVEITHPTKEKNNEVQN